MKKAFYFLLIEVAISLASALFFDSGIKEDYLTVFGLINLVLGATGLAIGVILSISKSDHTKAMLVSSAFLLLMGFLTCSAFPFKYGR
jgi:cytochrome bd-type quinol oxidase subunit 2